MTKKVLCGLVGCGHFAKWAYLPALNRWFPPLRLSGLYSRSRESTRSFQKMLRYRTDVFDSFEALLDSKVDCVVIVAPTYLHSRYILESLKRNIDVFCEKPVANTVRDALAVRDALQRSSAILMIGYNQRYLDRIRRLKRLIEQGVIGAVNEVSAYHNQDIAGHIMKSDWLGDAERYGGGVLHEAGTHLVNIMRYCFGDIETVDATFSNIKTPAKCAEDTAFCRFGFSSGVKGTLYASWANAVSSTYEHMVIRGERGTIITDHKSCSTTVCLDSRKSKRAPCRRETIQDSVYNELSHFCHCITHRMKPCTDIDDAIETLKITEAARFSSLDKKEARIGAMDWTRLCMGSFPR